MTPADFQNLLRQAAHGDMCSCELLVQHLVCPHCGRSPLNVSWPPPGQSQAVMAACFLCGWTTPHGLRLRQIPQALLAHRQVLARHVESIKHLVRDSFLDGAVIEPGMYRVEINQRTSARFTQEALRAALSNEEFDRIRNMMPIQTENYVTVKSNGPDCPPSFQPLPQFAPFCEMRIAEADRTALRRSATPNLSRNGPYDAEY